MAYSLFVPPTTLLKKITLIYFYYKIKILDEQKIKSTFLKFNKNLKFNVKNSIYQFYHLRKILADMQSSNAQPYTLPNKYPISQNNNILIKMFLCFVS
jgi:hypothetical protein